MAKNKKLTLRDKFIAYAQIKKVSKVKRAVAFFAFFRFSHLFYWILGQRVCIMKL